MGCSHSGFISAISPANMDKLKNCENSQMTQDQIDRVQQSWKMINDYQDFGLLIMARIYTKHSEIKHKWIFAKDLNTEEEIRKNPQVVYHAKKIIETLSSSISTINMNNSEYKEICHLGKNHYNYGVRPGDFEHFEECLFYCLEKKIFDDRVFDLKTKAAWKKFFWTLVGKLCEGIYMAEIDELNSINKATK